MPLDPSTTKQGYGYVVAAGSAYLLLVLTVLVLNAAGVTAGPSCFFQRLTDVPCPGCGTTRMVTACLQGRWLEALAYNPLMLSLALLLIVVAIRRVIGSPVWLTSQRRIRRLTIAFVALMLLNWIYILDQLPPH